ncbi:MAG: hypothetical protein ACPH8B_00640 [Candidatus Puniceispirillum sp.]
MPDRDGSKSSSTAVKAEDRLASALRENLFRRKAQARARANSGDAGNAASKSVSMNDVKSSVTKSDVKG